MLNQKRGWIRIVEASVAILFLAGVSLLVLNQGNIEIGKDAFSNEVHESQISILRSIQSNDTLRASIIETDISGGDVKWEDSEFPSNIKSYVEKESSSALECEASICSLSSSCILESPGERNIYSESAFISVTTTQSPEIGYSPRKLKLFCWSG